jgi:predicted methyltransferase
MYAAGHPPLPPLDLIAYTREQPRHWGLPSEMPYLKNLAEKHPENAQFAAKFIEPTWTDRLKKPVMQNVVRVDREMDDPLPPEAKDLDLVVIVLLYHDAVWLKVDRDKMNRAIFAALKPGGAYVVVDHSARAGTGTNDVQSIHRIEQKVVEEEVARAGFKRAAEADFLRNPGDTRDWSTAPNAAGEKRGTSDRFVVSFVKP